MIKPSDNQSYNKDTNNITCSLDNSGRVSVLTEDVSLTFSSCKQMRHHKIITFKNTVRYILYASSELHDFTAINHSAAIRENIKSGLPFF